jgi:alpha-amylase/alpha-mannosidase (GH57 family)
MRYLCVHSHFYQPPRENPWLEAIELQDSAYPYHDWNERVMAECYAPNTATRIHDSDNKILKIVNNYASISFNFGATLLSWIKDKAPEGYHSILQADRMSAERFSGHGSAIAQCYNHMIMPLANRRDKHTQVYWGIQDFRYRFQRMPKGMWLPETAVDLKTLEVFAELGIRFTILAPSQAGAVNGEDVSGGRIDPKQPYLLKLPSGREIAIFFYDGPIARAVAFEDLLTNGERFAERLLSGFSEDRDEDQLVHIATDGETYGHHRAYGEIALAYALDHIESNGLARITNYGEYLAQHSPAREVKLLENTSWSCNHGIERWRANCGCNAGGHGSWNQAWRAPLRIAFDWLRDTVASCFEMIGRKYLKEPWKARNEYIHVILDRSAERREEFAHEHFSKGISPADRVKAWKLLEMQRHAMLMYTSCGWFFDELSGIETVQAMQYAARVVQLAEELFGNSIERDFLEYLALAESNIPDHGNGATVYEKFVKPAMLDLNRLGAHYAINSLFEDYGQHTRIYSYSVDRLDYRVMKAGKVRMAIGKANFTSEVTQHSESLTFGVLHFGDHNLQARVRAFAGERAYKSLVRTLSQALKKGDIERDVQLLNEGFGTEVYSSKNLFKDEQRKVLGEILKATVREAEALFHHLYGNHAPLLRFLSENNIPIPKEMKTTAEYALNGLLRTALSEDTLDLDRVHNLLDEVRLSAAELDRTTLEFTLRKNLERMSDRLFNDPLDIALLRTFTQAVAASRSLPLPLVLWSIQNKCYEVLQRQYPSMRERAAGDDREARMWTAQLEQLAELLMLRVPVLWSHTAVAGPAGSEQSA